MYAHGQKLGFARVGHIVQHNLSGASDYEQFDVTSGNERYGKAAKYWEPHLNAAITVRQSCEQVGAMIHRILAHDPNDKVARGYLHVCNWFQYSEERHSLLADIHKRPPGGHRVHARPLAHSIARSLDHSIARWLARYARSLAPPCSLDRSLDRSSAC